MDNPSWQSDERAAFVRAMFSEAPVSIQNNKQANELKPVTEDLFGQSCWDVAPHYVLSEHYNTPLYTEMIRRFRNQRKTDQQIVRIMDRISTEMPKREYCLVEEECAICLGNIAIDDNLYQLDHCGHSFHCKCMDPWILQGGKTCPMCRHKFLNC